MIFNSQLQEKEKHTASNVDIGAWRKLSCIVMSDTRFPNPFRDFQPGPAQRTPLTLQAPPLWLPGT